MAAARCSVALLSALIFLLIASSTSTARTFAGAQRREVAGESRPGLVRRGHALVRQTLARRAPIDLIADDGSLSLAKLLELRAQQLLEWQQWWNGTLPSNTTWRPESDDARLQKFMPAELRYPAFSQMNSSAGEAYYWNISGYYKGIFEAVELVPLPVNTTKPPSLRGRGAPDNASEPNFPAVRGNFPWLDAAGGTLDIEISEDHNISPNLTMIQGTLFLRSRAQSRSLWSSEVVAGASVRFDLTGVHYLGNGGLLLSALPAESSEVPDSRDVLRMLPPSVLPKNDSVPQDVPSRHPAAILNETWHSINRTLFEEVKRLTDLVRDNDPTEPVAQPADDRIAHNCTDFHLYLRLAPSTPVHPTEAQVQAIREYEHELFYSTGASPLGLFGQRAPSLSIAEAVFFSSRCNLVIQAGEPQFRGLDGLRYIAHRRKVMRAALCLAIITLLQLRLTMNMMRRARTASARVKIDWRTLLLQTIADMYTSILCAIPAVVWRNETNLLLVAVSYVVGCHFVGGEYQFLIFVVHDSQNDPLNNRPPPTATAIAAPQATANATAEAGTTTADVPATAVTDDATATVDQAANERRQRTYRYIAILVIFFLLNFQPAVFFSILGPVLYSFWIPQIMRNVKRGSRRPFPRKYIIGMTACRSMMPLYFWQCPNNIFMWEPTPLVWILIAYIWIQALLLLLQDELGPAFFLPARYQPESSPSWDWHPPLSVLRKHIRQAGDQKDVHSHSEGKNLELEAHLDAGAKHGHPNSGLAGQQFEIEIGDCAICLSEIEPLRWDWRDELEEASAAANDGDAESDEEDAGDGEEYAYVAVDGADTDTGDASGTSRSRRSTSTRRTSDGADASVAGHSGRGGSTQQAGRRRRHVRTGSLLSSWASSAVRIGRRVGRAISAAREHGGRGRSGAAAASAALGGGRTDIMVAPCHHIFHTECLERWLQYKSECPSCRMPLPPA